MSNVAASLPQAPSGTESSSRSLLIRTKIQTWIGLLFFIPYCGSLILAMKYVFRYRVENHAEMRKLYRELAQDPRPLMICSNHLTYVDPCIIIWALANHFWYFFNFRKLTWNLPAIEYKTQNRFFRTTCYLAKCLFIDRNGAKTHQNEILNLVRQLLENGEPVTIFPEGTRSKTGVFDPSRLKHGAGKIIAGMKECRVLCLYVRDADLESKHTSFPKKGTSFHIAHEVIVPKFESNDRQAYAEIMTQIGETIHRLQQERYASK